MYITHIESTVKVGIDAHLGKKTIVIGKNGTGKTALLNSIELALCGWASDYRGKAQIKRPADIIRLAQDKEITVALTMSNGKTRTYHTKKRGKGATKAKTTGRAITTHFPHIEIQKILSGSAEVIKQWLMQHCDSESEGELRKILGKRYEDLKSFADRRKSDPAAVLEAYIDEQKTVRGDLVSEIDALENVIDMLGSEIPPTLPAERLQELTAKVQDMESVIRDHEIKTRTFEQLQKEEVKAKEESQLLFQAYSEAVDDEKECGVVAPVPQRAKFLSALRDKLMQLSEVHIALGSAQCLLCVNDAPVDFNSRIQRLSAQNAVHRDALAGSVRKEAASRRVQELRVEVEKFHGLANEAQRQRSALEGELQQYVPKIVEEHTRLVKELDDHAHATRQWRSVQAKRDEKDEKEEQFEGVKEFISLLRQAKTAVVSGAKDAFVEKVNQFLPESKHFFVEFNDTQADYGFEVDGRKHYGLSGGEMAQLTIALARVTADEESFNIFTHTDKALDIDTLGFLMENLSVDSGQIILFSVFEPSSVPEDWTVVRLDS